MQSIASCIYISISIISSFIAGSIYVGGLSSLTMMVFDGWSTEVYSPIDPNGIGSSVATSSFSGTCSSIGSNS